MRQEHDYTQESLKKDAEERGAFSTSDFVNVILKPGVFGAFVMVVSAKLIPCLVQTMISSKSIDELANETFASLNQDFDLLFSGEFGRTFIWGFMLIGAVLGIFLRHVFGQERVR